MKTMNGKPMPEALTAEDARVAFPSAKQCEDMGRRLSAWLMSRGQSADLMRDRMRSEILRRKKEGSK